LGLVLKAGVLYFAAVFAAGFTLGAVRVTLIAPRIGERAAELMETPVMLAVIVLSARWVVRRFALASAPAIRLGTGMLALVLMLAAEFCFVLRLRGLTVAEYLASRDPVTGTAYYASLGVFALMPLVVGRNRGVPPLESNRNSPAGVGP
jgi:hypothetical protein